jgi:hypothetical protein
VVVAAVPVPVVVTLVTVTVLVAVPSVAATADTNRRLKAVVWAAVAVSVPPESDCVASSVVRTVVVGTPQAAAAERVTAVATSTLGRVEVPSYSDDPALLKAFHDGLDVHKATAAEVFGLTPDTVSSEQRRYAKVINFGLIYGMSAFGLAKALGIDNTAAKNYITRYFERFAGVKRYMDDTREQAKAQGYVETVFGRRLYLPEINSPNGPRRAGAERGRAASARRRGFRPLPGCSGGGRVVCGRRRAGGPGAGRGGGGGDGRGPPRHRGRRYRAWSEQCRRFPPMRQIHALAQGRSVRLCHLKRATPQPCGWGQLSLPRVGFSRARPSDRFAFACGRRCR